MSFGGQTVLDHLTWTIKPARRIGLIGANGAGKTTLLRVLAGLQDTDEGSVAQTTAVGYLAQDAEDANTDHTVLEKAMSAFVKVSALQRQEEEITRALATEPDEAQYGRLLGALERVHTELEVHDAQRVRPRTEAVLEGLGFETQDFERPLRALSGGYRMRVSLAQLLLRKPDVLLLDEPTNHLDIVSIDWLETYLKSYTGTVLLVSHDRYFLNRMVTSIAHLYGGKITEYAGNYSFFLAERRKRRALEQAAYDNQQRQIAQAERFIARFRYKNTKARQVQSRIKQLEKMVRLAMPEALEAQIRIRFPAPRPSGRTVLSLSAFSKSYDARVHVFCDAGPLTIERGDKIALVGKNGAGKSTLARILYGTESFDGARQVGYHVDASFFAQHQADFLTPDHTALASVQEVAYGQDEGRLRSLLGAFLFTGDDVFKKVRVLSGGEKSRLALARTLVDPANFLILDEPTNHLDIQSIQVLIEALRQYAGSFVVVSHDRHFLDQIVNAVWYVSLGRVRAYKGTYSEYQWYTEHGTASRINAPEAPSAAPAPKKGARSGGPKTKEEKRREAEDRNRAYRAMQNGDLAGLTARQIRTLCNTTEATIEEMEARRKAAEATLRDPDVYSNPARASDVSAQYESLQRDLDGLYQRWEELAQRL